MQTKQRKKPRQWRDCKSEYLHRRSIWRIRNDGNLWRNNVWEFPRIQKNSRPQNEEVPITIQKKTHLLIFFGMKWGTSKPCPSPMVKTSSRKNISQKKIPKQNKKQINIIFILKVSSLDLRKQQINIFKVLQEKIFESKITFYSAKLLNVERNKKYFQPYTVSKVFTTCISFLKIRINAWHYMICGNKDM